MSTSENYQRFKKQLGKMQSAVRVSTSAAAAVAVATNLPDDASVNVPNLVRRVARFKGIALSPREESKTRALVAHQLNYANA